MEYNIYCDESCHLEKSEQKYMTIGCISIDKMYVKSVRNEIINIKKENEINKYAEIKWSKVSNSKLDYYKQLLDYFFNNKHLTFRALVADKTKLNHIKYNQTHDDWYYKMFYQLLINKVETNKLNNIYLDKKDTKSSKKLKELNKYLSYKFAYNEFRNLQRVQNINSHESVILQLADLIIGAICYNVNNMHKKDNASSAKIELINYIKEKSGYSLENTTICSEKKFNLFFINLNGEKYE